MSGINRGPNQQAAQWRYSIMQGGTSLATYPGNVQIEGELIGGAAVYQSVAAVQAANIPASTLALSTSGYYSPGDGGGAFYVRAVSAAPGSILSADGTNWQIVMTGSALSPRQFGATPETFNSSAIIKTALDSGFPIDARGETFALTAAVVPANTFRGLENIVLRWQNNFAMGLQLYQLDIQDCNNFYLRNVKFDLGNRQNCGSADDSSRGGLRIRSSNPGVLWNRNVTVENIEAYGDGNGTRIFIRNCQDARFINLTARDGIAANTPDPTNDCINGVDISQCSNVQIENINSHNFQVVLAGVPTREYSRAILFFELNNANISDTLSFDCAQGVDFSGAIGAGSPNGNEYITYDGGVSYNCRDWGFKFANVAKDIRGSNLTAYAFGRGGFVFSPQSAGGTDASATQRITLTNCVARNPSQAGARGFWAAETGAKAGYPRNVFLYNCQAYEDNGNGFLTHSFLNQVTYDGVSRGFNEIIGCRGYGYTVAFNDGWVTHSCQVNGTSNVSIPNNAATVVNWDSEIYDPARMHSNTVNPELIRVAMPGLYKVTAGGEFAANATGARMIRILKNGAIYPGGTFNVAAAPSGVTGVSVSVDMQLLPTDTVRVEVLQTSGGALNFNRILSSFSVALIEAWQ